MPPIVWRKKGGRWGFAYAKMVVQICIFALGSALQSPKQLWKSFCAPILHTYTLAFSALQSRGYKLLHVCEPLLPQLAHVCCGPVATQHGAG